MKKLIKILKEKGQVFGKELAFSQLENLLNLLPNGEYNLRIEKIVKKRSIEQNRLMWLWFACIEKETGTPKEDIHDYYCEQFLKRYVTINGAERVAVSGTSKLNTVQFTDFLNKVQADATSEFGITLPNPDDLHWKEFEEYYRNYI